MLDLSLPSTPRLSDLHRLFLSWSASFHKKNTTEIYRHYFRQHVERLGDIEVSKACPALFAAVCQTWHSASAAKRLFGWAKDEARIISDNALTGLKLPTRAKRRRVMTPTEAAKILRASSPDFRAICLAWRESFARPGEMRRVRWSDLRSSDPSLTVHQALAVGSAYVLMFDAKDASKRKHADTIRVILISPRLGRLLSRMWRRRESEFALIFQTSSGRAWTRNAVRCRWRRLLRRLGIDQDGRGEKLVPYSWRHTGATAAAAAGVRDRQLADILGHVETRTTTRYVHLSPDELRASLIKSGLWSAPKK